MTPGVDVTPHTNGAVEQAEPEGVNSLVRMAIDKGVPVEMLERLVALQERVTERNAEMEMAEALAAFQRDCPSIARSKTADTGKYKYTFAPFEEVAETIRPHLAKHGLSYTHDGKITDGGLVKIRCTLMHIAGAKRTATFTGPFDNSGGKNPIQAIASARSYGRRYSLTDVLGLSTADEDDDGHKAGTQLVDDQQLADLSAKVEEVGVDKAKFCEYMGVESLADIPTKRYAEALNALEARRRNGRKR